MIEKAILHIGLHKTGSSSIQASLNGYDDGCRFYADLDWQNHSIPLYTAFSRNASQYHIWTKQGASPEQVKEVQKTVLHKLERQLSRPSHNTIIFSGEDLSQLSQSDTNDFVAFMRARCQHIIAVAYVRDPLEYAASAFQQLVKGGCNQIPNKISQHIEARISNWELALGTASIYVRSFNRDTLLNGCVVHDFCQFAGLDTNLIRFRRRNESLSGAAIKILFHLNQTSQLQFGDALLARTRRRLINLLDRLFGDLPGIDKYLMLNQLDWQDAEYIRLKHPSTEHRTLQPNMLPPAQDLDEWVNDLDSIIHTRLSDWLAKHEQIESWRGNTSELIHRTFYAILQTDITNSSSELLTRSALKLKENSADNLSDPIQLLELAHHARPFNKKIKRILQKLQTTQGLKNP
jgi:hypothetical protein